MRRLPTFFHALMLRRLDHTHHDLKKRLESIRWQRHDRVIFLHTKLTLAKQALHYTKASVI